jgi:hypothetical protein
MHQRAAKHRQCQRLTEANRISTPQTHVEVKVDGWSSTPNAVVSGSGTMKHQETLKPLPAVRLTT